MRTKYIVFGLAGVLVGILLSSAVVVLAGNLDPPSAATDAASQMFTLQQVYRRLNVGASGVKMTSFTEPSSGPGSGTMHTLDEIMALAPVADNTNGAQPDDVRSGTTYWGLRTDGWRATAGWGPQTGELHGGCTCTGNLVGTRWCDNEDGTVTDLLGYGGVGQCLVWLKDADCDADLAGINKTDKLLWSDAMAWSSVLADGRCDLDDGSSKYVWRLPTRAELVVLTDGVDPISSTSMQAFTNVKGSYYWSSTTWDVDGATHAWVVSFGVPGVYNLPKGSQPWYVWPVRGGP
jgi:hypothetical protein